MTEIQSHHSPAQQPSSNISYLSVHEVFKSNSIADIRSLEIQLRDQAAQRRTDLQVLVGESYRDLLTTADTLVRMRDETLTLRAELATLTGRCDEEGLRRVIANGTRLFVPQAQRRQQVLISFLRDVRGLILSLASQGDVLTACQVWVLAEACSKTMPMPLHLKQSLISAKRLLMKFIDHVDDVAVFATAHCQLHSSTLAECLRQWLTLQPARWRGCLTLNSLAKAIITTTEQLRHFARLADPFEDASKQILANTVAKLPELDGPLIKACLPSDLAKQRVGLPPANLSHSEIQASFETWLKAETAAIQCIIQECLLAQDDSMEDVLLAAKQVRGFLDEASQDALYIQLFSPAVDHFIATVLDRSLVGFAQVRETLTALVSSVPQDTQQMSLLSASVPWQQRELHSFVTTTRRIVRGDLVTEPFAAFDKSYRDVSRAVAAHLTSLSTNKTFQQGGYKDAYSSRVEAALVDLLQLLQELSLTVQHNKPALIQISRVLAYICKTAPIPLDGQAAQVTIAEKLVTFLPESLPLVLAKELVAPDEAGLPSLPSPACSASLVACCRLLESWGVDVVGPGLRAEVRQRITVSIEEALEREQLVAVDETDEASVLPQHRPSAPPTPLLAPIQPGEPLTSQAAFDALFVSALLSLNLEARVARAAQANGVDTKQMESAVTSAVTKSRLFYKTLIA
ncbi:hypothetical protein BCR37DRAFT_390201 [Protomyces lactucae-debilis]|uniref:Conserved oligomeric Golgi complex subunit 1 n=1 Tax=Protomyces lactucae-debilis TaxID=2754530 RepID=A0A1Y2FUN9_PROLT|nr:uncharacterized protein BCR37DRAFT_390201 [Protomyces lactucae-debilis]ORY87669.1 hypothetical protein BCR37DRAFT_390201 [Protomyces lactucae-debilis]